MKFAKTKLLTLSVTLALATNVAQAQDSEQEANDDEESKKLDRVTVTATRRGDTDILTTPVAVTAVTPEEFEVVMPNNVGDVAAFVPNFSAALITNFNAASFSMRGIGQTDIIVYLDPPVGVTVDDFVMPSVQTQLLEVFDIESIEVLRGPQGTLYGKNTTGGAINIRTKRPEIGEGGGQVIGQVGSFGRTKGQLAVNVPISESWAFRFAGVYDQSDGYYKNGAEYGPIDPNGLFYPIPGITGTSGAGDGSDVGGKDVFAGRAKLLFQPNSDLEALFQYEMIRDQSDSAVTINETPLNDPRYVFNNLGWTQDVGGDPLDNAGFTNRDDVLLRMSEGHRVDVDGLYLNVDWNLSDTLSFASVTGYREQESRLPNSYGAEAGPISQFDATRDDDRETFQQEFRLLGNQDDMSWVAGVFYQENDAEFCVSQILGFLDLFGLGAANFGEDLFFTNNPQVLCNKQQADAWAVYGDVSFDLTDQWNLTLGARYTDEKKSWQGRNQIFYQALTGGFDPTLTWQDFNEPLEAGNFGLYPTGVVSDEESWGEPTYRATIGYDFSEDSYGYFTYSRGFKSGGYNDQTGTSGNPITAAQARPYDPEFADSYEVGFKTTLGNGRVYLAATAFYVEYEDAQRSLVSTIENEFGETFQETQFFNAAEITVNGLELEATWRASQNFTIRGNLGYQDGQYDKYEADTDGDGTIDVDFSNRPLNRAPEWQAMVDGSYYIPMNSGSEFQINGNVVYEDDNVYFYSDQGRDFDTILNAKTLFNASVTYRDAAGKYWIRGFAKNITDERYRTSSQPVADLWTNSTYGEPRSYGVEFGYNFNW